MYYLIRGYQEGEDKRYYKIVADCKHYAGYDVENWHGYVRDGYDAKISMQDLVETYLPSFKSCMKDAHVGSAMCSYNVSPHTHPKSLHSTQSANWLTSMCVWL